MSAMGALVAGVAHEVRNPLFAISATLDAFEARFGESVGFQKYHQVLRGELARLTSFMQDLLNYGKPTSLDLSMGNLEEPLRSALKFCEHIANEKSIHIQVDNLSKNHVLVLDKGKMSQVFHNLIENSIYFSPKNSTISIEISSIKEKENHWISCSIKDSGPGFLPEDLQKLFVPFFSRRRGGTGLGLCIAQKFIEEHKGSIKIQNHPEDGAFVLIRLPVQAS
jgi:signal transduction histidine kinase